MDARGTPRLSTRAHALVTDAGNDLLVSAVSAHAVCQKHMLGKLPGVAALVAGFERAIIAADCAPLVVTMAHAELAGSLDPSHRDPFDRLLIAQALIERVPLVSNDAIFDRFGIERVW